MFTTAAAQRTSLGCMQAARARLYYTFVRSRGIASRWDSMMQCRMHDDACMNQKARSRWLLCIQPVSVVVSILWVKTELDQS